MNAEFSWGQKAPGGLPHGPRRRTPKLERKPGGMKDKIRLRYRNSPRITTTWCRAVIKEHMNATDLSSANVLCDVITNPNHRLLHWPMKTECKQGLIKVFIHKHFRLTRSISNDFSVKTHFLPTSLVIYIVLEYVIRWPQMHYHMTITWPLIDWKSSNWTYCSQNGREVSINRWFA